MIRRVISRFAAVCALASVVAITGTALAFFTTGGAGTAAAAVTTLGTPTISSATAATGGTVTVTWKAVTAPGEGTVTYYVTRNGQEADGNCPTLEEPGTGLTCVDSGLSPGTYEYKVTALYQSWSKTSAVVTAKVTVGPVSKFAIAGTPTSPSTGAGVNLTITAQDAAGGTVTTFAGAKSLTFAGAANGPEGTVPTVVSSAGTAVAFGTATPITFTNGVAAAASSKNGYLKIFKAGEANVTATEGSLTTPVPLTLNVLPTATKFTLAVASTTPTAGTGDNLTISAFDSYGNPSTNFTGSHNIVFSPTTTSPGGNAATVDNSAGSPIAFGSATALVFTNGVSTVSAGANGEMYIYKSGTLTTLKATEGSITNSVSPSITVAPAAAASLTTTASLATEPTTTGFTLTTTAKDPYGNTATSYTGEKKLTFTGTGTATETSPGGSVAAVVNNANVAVPLGTATPITFTNGVAASASSKNGYLRLYKPGSASITATDGTFTTSPLALTVTIGAAKRVAFNTLTASPGTVSSTCFFTCSITALGNSGTISSKLMITDEYGNLESNIGASKTATISVTAGSPLGTISGSPLSFPETGSAISTTAFTYTAPASGSYTTNTITAASTGYTSATATAAK